MMNKKTYISSLLLAFLLACLPTFRSAAQSVDWFDITRGNKAFGSSNYFKINGFYADERHLYVSSSVDFPSVVFCNSKDTLHYNHTYGGQAYLAQYTHTGQLRWAKIMGTGYPTMHHNKSHSVVKNGNTYFLAIDFFLRDSNNNITFTDFPALTLSKIDENGNQIWQKYSQKYTFQSDFIPLSMVADEAENIYVVVEANARRSLIFDSIVPPHQEKLLLYKFDKNGRALYAIPLPSEDIGFKDIKFDKNGNLNLLFSKGGRNWWSSCFYTTWDNFILRINPISKKIEKAVSFSANDLMWCNRFQILPNGDFMIVGSTRGQLTIGKFKTEKTYCEGTSQFMMRISNKGELIWYKDYPKIAFSDAMDIVREDDNHFLLAGISTHPNSEHYPNKPGTPNGKERFFIKRLTNYGQITDSLEFYIYFRDNNMFGDARVLTVDGKIFVGCNLVGEVDTLGGCAEDWLYGQSNFIAKLSNQVLKKRQQLPLSTGVEIFPNPAPNGQFLIRMKSFTTKEKVIRVFNAQGILVAEKQVEADIVETNIDISYQPSGIYFVQTWIGEEKIISKVVKP